MTRVTAERDVYHADINCVVQNEGTLHAKTYSCDSSCKRMWTDGQILEWGKDYHLRADNDPHDRYDPVHVVFPNGYTPPDQDILWGQLLKQIDTLNFQHKGITDFRNVEELKKSGWVLTKKDSDVLPRNTSTTN
jgi:hypothetical protein